MKMQFWLQEKLRLPINSFEFLFTAENLSSTYVLRSASVHCAVTLKALEIRYALMDCYLVDIYWLKKLLEGTKFETLTLNIRWRHNICQFVERWEIHLFRNNVFSVYENKVLQMMPAGKVWWKGSCFHKVKLVQTPFKKQMDVSEWN